MSNESSRPLSPEGTGWPTSCYPTVLYNAMSRERVLKTYVNEVKKNYDYVLIDCVPSLGMITINALTATDSVIIPTQPLSLG